MYSYFSYFKCIANNLQGNFSYNVMCKIRKIIDKLLFNKNLCSLSSSSLTLSMIIDRYIIDFHEAQSNENV